MRAETKAGMLAVGAAFLSQMVVTLSVFTVPVLAPAAAGPLGVAASQIGAYVFLLYGGATLSALLGAGLPARLGGMRTAQLALLLNIVGLLAAASGSVTTLLLGGILIGAGFGIVSPANAHVLSRWISPAILSFAFAINLVGVPIGRGLSGVVVPPLIAAFGWQAAAMAIAALCLLSAALLQPAVRRFDQGGHPSRPRADIRSTLAYVFQTRALAMLTVTACALGIAEVGVAAYLVTFLTEELAVSLVDAGLVLSLSQVAGGVGRLTLGYVVDRGVRSDRMLVGVSVAVAAGLCGFAAMTPAWPLVAVAAVGATFGAAANGWYGVFLAEVTRRSPPGYAGVAAGGVMFFTFAGTGLGPPILGLLARGFSYDTAFVVMAVIALVGGVFAVLAAREAPASSR